MGRRPKHATVDFKRIWKQSGVGGQIRQRRGRFYWTVHLKTDPEGAYVERPLSEREDAPATADILVAVEVAKRLRGEAEVQAARRAKAQAAGRPVVDTLDELIGIYCDTIEREWVNEDGHKDPERLIVKSTLQHLAQMQAGKFGRLHPDEFDANCLEQAQHEWRDHGGMGRDVDGKRHRKPITLKWINCRTKFVKDLFKWAAKRKYVTAETAANVGLCDPLKKNRSGKVTRSVRVTSGDPRDVEMVAFFGTAQIRAMMRLQLHSMCRGAELFAMKPESIDKVRVPGFWVLTVYIKRDTRYILLNETCQLILTPFLAKRQPGEYVFQPYDNRLEYHAARNAARVTPDGQGNGRGDKDTGKQRARSQPRFNKDNYRKAVHDAWIRCCDYLRSLGHAEDKMPEFVRPHRIRHTAATEAGKAINNPVAIQKAMNHKHMDTTQIYVDLQLEQATPAAKALERVA